MTKDMNSDAGLDPARLMGFRVVKVAAEAVALGAKVGGKRVGRVKMAAKIGLKAGRKGGGDVT